MSKIKIEIKTDKVNEIKKASRQISIKPQIVAPVKKHRKRYNKPTKEDIES